MLHYLLYILTSGNIFIINFDPGVDQALYQLRRVNAHEGSSFVTIWSHKKRRMSRKEGEEGKTMENTVEIISCKHTA